MKLSIILFITIFIFYGCMDGNKNKPPTDKTSYKEINLVSSVKSFYNQHSNWYLNDVIIKRTNIEFEKKLVEFTNLTLP